MNILADYVGHADLYYSMHLLFEQRIGGKLYRPSNYCASWQEHGVTTSAAIQASEENDSSYGKEVLVQPHSYKQALLSFNSFLLQDIDLIVVTGWENEQAFYNLWKKYKPKAKFIRHIANIHELPKLATNILLSTMTPMPAGINWITYHPEHHAVYSYEPDVTPTRPAIRSFFNFVLSMPVDAKRWTEYKNALLEYQFNMHGIDCEEPPLSHNDLHNVMKDSTFVWHTKGGGCCGYVARQALSCGRPLIVDKKYCDAHQTLAKNYLIDGENCIDLSARSFEANVALIREWSRPEIYPEVCKRVKQVSEKLFNFAGEAEQIREWLKGLK